MLSPGPKEDTDEGHALTLFSLESPGCCPKVPISEMLGMSLELHFENIGIQDPMSLGAFSLVLGCSFGVDGAIGGVSTELGLAVVLADDGRTFEDRRIGGC